MTSHSHSRSHAARRARPTSIAELRAVAQPPGLRPRSTAGHGTPSIYLRDLSPYLTLQLLKTSVTANGVTALMILVGWSSAAALLLPGVWGALLALLLGQLQMLLACCDGEVARWRGEASAAGAFLDKVGHYTTEALIAIAFGVRAAAYPVEAPADLLWTTLALLLALVIVLNNAINDVIHAAEATSDPRTRADTRAARAPTSNRIARPGVLAALVPFRRLHHSGELTVIIFASAVVGRFLGEPLVDRVVLVALVPLSLLALFGHVVASRSSRRVRS